MSVLDPARGVFVGCQGGARAFTGLGLSAGDPLPVIMLQIKLLKRRGEDCHGRVMPLDPRDQASKIPRSYFASLALFACPAQAPALLLHAGHSSCGRSQRTAHGPRKRIQVL